MDRYYVVCDDHVIARPSLDSAQAHADVLNANGAHDPRLCQRRHVGLAAEDETHARRLYAAQHRTGQPA